MILVIVSGGVSLVVERVAPGVKVVLIAALIGSISELGAFAGDVVLGGGVRRLRADNRVLGHLDVFGLLEADDAQHSPKLVTWLSELCVGISA